MITYNDLLIEILNMTTEQRKQVVRVTQTGGMGWCPSDDCISCDGVETVFGEAYITTQSRI
jgi:hypothetical protein